jgi:glycerophosphoryl diester phosphodiesterase
VSDVPLIIAHRTCQRDAPENSRLGVRTAARLAADHVEVDVRLTSDGVPVLLHDPLLLRTAWWPVPVRWLRARRVASVRLRGTVERVPSLSDALRALPDGVGIAIDIKDRRAAPAVISELRTQRLLDRALLWSQHEEAVRHAAAAAGTEALEVALLRDTADSEATERFVRDALAWGATAISAHQDVVDDAFLDDCHARGLRVHTWVQDRTTQQTKAHLELDGIVTDWPVEARALVEQRR